MRLPSFVVLVVLTTGLACSTVASDDDEAGVTTNHGSGGDTDDTGSGSTGTGTSTGTTGTTGNDDSSADDPMKLDLPFMGDVMQVEECTTTWITWDDVKVSFPDCMLVPSNGGDCWTEPVIGCTPPGPGGECNCPDGDCIGDWGVCTGDLRTWFDAVPSNVCGPFVLDGLCCTIGEFITTCTTG